MAAIYIHKTCNGNCEEIFMFLATKYQIVKTISDKKMFFSFSTDEFCEDIKPMVQSFIFKASL